MKKEIRLQKAIADSGVCSRRSAEELIIKGQVFVNKKKASLGMSVDCEKDEIFVNGKKIKFEEKVYFALNKPKGVISTASDDRKRKSVLDIVKCDKRIYPVGRLDRDTIGLLILTNDGELVNVLTHPKYGHEKTYIAIIQVPHRWEDKDIKKAISKMEKGVRIADGFKTSPAKVSILERVSNDRHSLSITIKEGHKHQVRQMINACMMTVVSLKRVKFGPIELSDLEEGQYRALSEKEISLLKELAQA